ncbi:MAG: VTT domain-containing protein [Candidatus Nomurabacteria bacterium]
MTIDNLNNITNFLMSHGYLFFFIFSCIEGSLIGTAGGILARIGYFNIFFVIIISILGDIVPDIVYYLIGRYGNSLVTKIKIFKRDENRLKKFLNLKELTEKHPIKSLIFVKFSPFMGPLGLITIGSFKPDIKKYIKNVSIITVFKSLFFVLLGYLSSGAYIYLFDLMNSSTKAIAVSIITILVGFIAYKIFINNEIRNIKEKNNLD